MSKKLIPAAVYIRMSSDQQEASPEQQREEVAKLAERHGCIEVKEYFDDAISGIETVKRKSFVRLIDDAKAGKFEVILAWDQDRFGRFDSIDAGEWIAPLRRAGVRLITVAQGEIDWTSFAGRIIYAVQQEGKNQFLHDLSRNVLRGRIAASKRGLWCGRLPYGYERVFYGSTGKVVYRSSRADGFRKPKEWDCRLELSRDKAEVDTVRWLFRTFADTSCSLLSLVKDLNRRGVPSPCGLSWSYQTVLVILTNVAYLGHAEAGRRRSGKFHSISTDGSIEASNGGAMRAAPIVVKDAHAALIDEATFRRVQNKLISRKMGNRAPRTGGYILSGILFCGHCGRKMVGKSSHARGRSYKYYTCSTGTSTGKCSFHSIRQECVESFLTDALLERIRPETIDRLRAAIEKQLKQRAASGGGDGAAIKARIEKLSKAIRRGTDNLLLAQRSEVADMSARVAELRGERDALQVKVDAQARSKPASITLDEAMAQLTYLQERFNDGAAESRREVFQRVFERVTLWWEGKGHSTRLAKGLIVSHSSNTASALLAQRETVFTRWDVPGVCTAIEQAAVAVHKLANGKPATIDDVAGMLDLEYDTAHSRLNHACAGGLLTREKTRRFVAFRPSRRLLEILGPAH